MLDRDAQWGEKLTEAEAKTSATIGLIADANRCSGAARAAVHELGR